MERTAKYTPEERKERVRQMARDYAKNNPEKHKANSKAYYEKHKQAISEKRKQRAKELKEAYIKLKAIEAAVAGAL